MSDPIVPPQPCPFCGGTPYVTRTVNGTQMFKVGCVSCGVELKTAWYRGEDQPTKDILTLWNTRAAAPVVQPVAQEYFDACYVEARLDEALCAAFGIDIEMPDPWPFRHMVYDPYDGSFEIWQTQNDFVPTDEQLQAVFALGFARGWICYQDGTEVYVYDGGLKRGDRKPSPITRDSEMKWQVHKATAEARRWQSYHAGLANILDGVREALGYQRMGTTDLDPSRYTPTDDELPALVRHTRRPPQQE